MKTVHFLLTKYVPWTMECKRLNTFCYVFKTFNISGSQYFDAMETVPEETDLIIEYFKI